jgi:hypothetical protein
VSDRAEALPELPRPADVVDGLLESVRAHGVSQEVVYLDSNLVDHRWGADTFDDLKEEFKYKTIWVAKQLRDALGSPDPSAFVRTLDRFDLGLCAAAWWKRGLVVFVCLRHQVNRQAPALDKDRFVIVLGVAEPSPDDPDPDGDEARVAAGMMSLLIH